MGIKYRKKKNLHPTKVHAYSFNRKTCFDCLRRPEEQKKNTYYLHDLKNQLTLPH